MGFSLNFKKKIITVPVIFVSVLIFGFYAYVYSGIFSENVFFSNKASANDVKLEDSSKFSANVLGEKETSELGTSDSTELRMNSATQLANKSAQNQIAFGVAVFDYTNNAPELGDLQKGLNGKISSVSIFKQFGNAYNNNINQDNVAFIKKNNLKLVIAWEPWNPDEGTKQSKDFLKEIIAGKQDSYLKSFAQEIKSFGNPVTIRFGHEMNGDWYPWGNRPDDYKSAYRYIVQFFRSEGVENVSWMWCINADNVPYTNIENARIYYPGDDVVDLVGIDGVNFGASQADSKWRSFKEIFTPAYAFLAKAYGKPLVIAETASSEVGGNKSQWISEMFGSLSTTFPKVQELIWFSINKETDWRINSSENSYNSFKKHL